MPAEGVFSYIIPYLFPDLLTRRWNENRWEIEKSGGRLNLFLPFRVFMVDASLKPNEKMKKTNDITQGGLLMLSKPPPHIEAIPAINKGAYQPNYNYN